MLVCRNHPEELPPARGFLDALVLATPRVRPRGEGAPTYLGYLIIEPRRHGPGLGDLAAEKTAATAVAHLVAACARVPREWAGADHVCSAVIGRKAAPARP